MPSDTPTVKVLQLRQQGLTNNQIIQTLQREGYAVTAIYDALNQAELKAHVEAHPMEQQYPTYQEPYQPPQQAQQYNQDTLQQLVEAVIEEKWEEIVKSMQRVIDWKDKTEQRLGMVEQDIKETKEAFTRLQAALFDKVGEYDKHIVNVGTELQALEKVFQKILPGFVESINDLSRITKDLKDIHGSEMKKKV